MDINLNDNNQFYGSEWVGYFNDGKDYWGLKFYSDDSVLLFSTVGWQSKGTFFYLESSKAMTIDGITINNGTNILQIDGAILYEGDLYVRSHIIGEEEEYQDKMEKVR